MSLDRSVVSEIAELAQKAAAPVAIETSDRVCYVINGALVEVEQPVPPVTPLVVHTLTGLADYLTADLDEFPDGECAIHVVGPQEVQVISPLIGRFQQRHVYARAVAYDCFLAMSYFRFNAFLSPDSIVLALHTLFERDAERDELLEVLGGLKVEDVSTLTDNGLVQEVAVRQGVATLVQRQVKRYLLAPYRTFTDVEQQPRSLFVLRLSKTEEGLKAGLFEADGGRWRDQAIAEIAKFLRAKVPQIPVIA
jgi:hypothetical protein